MSFALRRPDPRPHDRSERRRHHDRRRPPTRPLAVVVTAAALLGLHAATASAHVTVKPDVTASGGYAELVFRVPSEKPSASTTKVVLTLPRKNPFTEVSVESLPGWTVTVTDAPLPIPATVDGTTITEPPHLVTWTATAGDHHAAAPSGTDTAAAPVVSDTHGSADPPARWLSGAALVVALGAAALQVLNRRRHAG